MSGWSNDPILYWMGYFFGLDVGELWLGGDHLDGLLVDVTGISVTKLFFKAYGKSFIPTIPEKGGTVSFGMLRQKPFSRCSSID